MSPLKKTLMILLLVLIGLIAAGILFVGIKACVTVKNMQQGAVGIVERPSGAGASAGDVAEPDILYLDDNATPNPSADAEFVPGSEDDELSLSDIYAVDSINPDVINILLVGQDGNEYRENGSRTDTMMLLSYNPKAGTLKLLSFMRDSYVAIEGHGKNRLNTCYHFGGMGLLINTLNDTFGLDIQTYITLAFNDFEKLIDAFGGMDVELTRAEASWINQWVKSGRVSAGMQHLNGEQTLYHVRYRKSGNGDYGRTERQQGFMIELYNAARQNLTISTALELVDFVSSCVRTNMTMPQMTQLATDLMSGHALEITTARMPFDGTNRSATVNGASVIAIDVEENTRLIHAFLYGEE